MESDLCPGMQPYYPQDFIYDTYFFHFFPIWKSRFDYYNSHLGPKVQANIYDFCIPALECEKTALHMQIFAQGSSGELLFSAIVSNHMCLQLFSLIQHYTIKVTVDYLNHCRFFGPCCIGST